MNYELKLEQFSGPIEKLLELIEERKLEITEVNLAQVTADFLNYLNKLAETEEEQPRLLADFIVIASHLLLIKSKALLPNLQLTSEEEKNIKDLEARLQLYQQFKPAISHLGELWGQNRVSFSRPLFAGRPAIFYPAENIKLDELYKAIKIISEAFQQLSGESQTIKLSLIKLETKVEEIMSHLESDLKFNKLTKRKSNTEIIVLFLALLHLLSKQLIRVEQKDRFLDIIINKKSKIKNI